MQVWLPRGRTLFLICLSVGLAAIMLSPKVAAAQDASPAGVYLNVQATGTAGGDRTLLSLREDGGATLLFFNLEDPPLVAAYTGEWLLDPYGTITVELDVAADESCTGEEEAGTLTLLPSPSADVLTAVHYPMCLWGDGGLTLVGISDEQTVEIEDMYAAAGLLPGLVFQSEILAPAEGMQRQLTLNLGQADQALMLSDGLDGDAPAAEVGTWMATVYTVTVNLTGTVDSAYDEPDVLSFGFLKDGTGRMAAFEYDAAKYGDQGLLMTYIPQLPELMAAAEAQAMPEIPGVYTSDVLPAADSPGLVQTLALFENGALQNTYNYLNGEAPVVELGTWSDNGDGTVALEMTGTIDAEYAEPVTTTVTVTENQLDVDGTLLNKLPAVDVAAAATPIAIYQSDTLPAAASPGREIELVLYEDGTALMSTDYLNDEAPVEEAGTWELADDTLTVTLTGQAGQAYDAPVTIVFTDEGDQLVAVEYDESRYGTEGLVLYPQPPDAAETND